MPRKSRVWMTAALALLASCGRAPKTTGDQAAVPTRPLEAYAALRLMITPTARVRGADSLGWVQQLGGVRAAARRLDTNIVAVFDERGLASRWIMPADLERSYQRNRTYASDPYQLAVEPLRAATYVAGQKYGEPLSSQLRTMIALHEDGRLVMLPVELRFEREATSRTLGRAVLRMVILDPRFAESRFVSDVRGDVASAPGQALASVAARLADLFVAP